MFDLEFYKNKLLEKYKEKNDEEMYERYEHSLNVSKMCVELIERLHLNIDIDKAKLTGLIHDYAKFVTRDEYENLILEKSLDTSLIDKPKKIWHAILGRYVVENELDIHDEEILSAIEFHTTGKENMTPLEEVLFVSDYIEVGRKGITFERARELAFVNIKRAICYILDETIKCVLDRGLPLDPLTTSAYRYYKKYKKLDGDNKLENVLECINRNLVKDVMIYDMRERSPLYDYAIVATSASNKQMQAALTYLREEFTIKGSEVAEGWTLIDLGDMILHIFTEEDRNKYSLDKLYATLPIVENKIII